MKYVLIFFFVTGLFSLSFIMPAGNLSAIPAVPVDSTPVSHITDGLITEWPAGKFQADNDTTIFFAADNDGTNLYVALTVPEYFMQSKIMRNGMKLFVDTKGKKKENHGVEFPVSGAVNNFVKGTLTTATGSTGSSEANETRPKKEFDKKKARNIMSLGLTALKIFGMSGASSDEQGLSMPGSVNIAFKWDDSDVMHIEYILPLKMIDESLLSGQKEISLGLKINGIERLQNTNGGEEHAMGHDSFSGGMEGGRNGGMGFNNAGGRIQRRMTMAEMAKEQSIWTKYTLLAPVSRKAF